VRRAQLLDAIERGLDLRPDRWQLAPGMATVHALRPGQRRSGTDERAGAGSRGISDALSSRVIR